MGPGARSLHSAEFDESSRIIGQDDGDSREECCRSGVLGFGKGSLNCGGSNEEDEDCDGRLSAVLENVAWRGLLSIVKAKSKGKEERAFQPSYLIIHKSCSIDLQGDMKFKSPFLVMTVQKSHISQRQSLRPLARSSWSQSWALSVLTLFVLVSRQQRGARKHRPMSERDILPSEDVFWRLVMRAYTSFVSRILSHSSGSKSKRGFPPQS
jgi:hypothetical protein